MASQILTTEELLDMLYSRAKAAASVAEVVIMLEGVEGVVNEMRDNKALPLKGQIYVEMATQAISDATAQIPYRVREAL